MGTQRAASAGAAWGHTAALLLPTCAPHWWRTRFNCRLINEDCSHSDTKPAWGPNAAPAKQQNLSDHLPVPLSAVTAPKNCTSSRKMGTQTPIRRLWGRDPQPPDPHLQQEGDTHEAGRSCRRSMVKTTASSPADRKVHGESGSRASCKINTRALVPFSPNNALESLSPHNPPHIPAPSTPHGCVLLCQAAQQGPPQPPPHLCPQPTEVKGILRAHLVRSSLVLCHTLGAPAALRGRELSHPHLPVPSTHGQRGVTAVGEELGLEDSKQR